MESTVTTLQIIIGALTILGGVAKLVLPYARFSSIPAVAWSKDFKPEHLNLLGILETAGGLGLVAPLLLPGLAPLVPLAAVGVALYMAGAIATHLRRSEYVHMVGILLVFVVPSIFVAYGNVVQLVS